MSGWTGNTETHKHKILANVKRVKSKKKQLISLWDEGLGDEAKSYIPNSK